MCQHAEAEGIGNVARCMAAYDARTAAACARWGATLPAGAYEEVTRIVEALAAAAARRWRCWCDGEEEELRATADPQQQPPWHCRHIRRRARGSRARPAPLVL